MSSAGPAVAGDDGQDRQHARDGRRGAPVGHPVHALLAAVREHRRVRPAAVEPQHDPVPGGTALASSASAFGQRDRIPTAHQSRSTPPARLRWSRCRCPRGPSPPGPACCSTLSRPVSPGVGDEVGAIDVILHPGGLRAGRRRRGRERRLQLQRISGIGDHRQRRAQRPGRGTAHRPARPAARLRRGQVLDLLGRGRPQREARAHRRQQRHIPRIARPPQAGSPRPARDRRAAASPPHTGRTPRCPPPPAPSPNPGGTTPGLPAAQRRLGLLRPLPVLLRHGSRLRPRPLIPARRASRAGIGGVPPAAAFAFCAWAGPSRRSTVDCCTPGQRATLSVPHPGRPPCPGLFPVLLRYRARAAPRPDQPRGPVPSCPLVSVGRVGSFREPQRRRDLRAAEPDLPQRRHRDVPGVGGVDCRRTGTAQSSRRRSTSLRPSAAPAGQQRLACPPGWQTRRPTACPNRTVS